MSAISGASPRGNGDAPYATNVLRLCHRFTSRLAVRYRTHFDIYH